MATKSKHKSAGRQGNKPAQPRRRERRGCRQNPRADELQIAMNTGNRLALRRRSSSHSLCLIQMGKGNNTPLQIQKGQKPTVPTGSAGSRKNGQIQKTAPDKQNRPENQHKKSRTEHESRREIERIEIRTSANYKTVDCKLAKPLFIHSWEGYNSTPQLHTST